LSSTQVITPHWLLPTINSHPEYKFVKKWGSKGNGTGQFQRPHDLDFSNDEKILYTVDRDGNRIQAFDKNGTFLFSWGELGKGDGQFHVPYGIDVDANGNVWVADRANQSPKI
jgi:DNA-binding beta-propeller fold protein YncE